MTEQHASSRQLLLSTEQFLLHVIAAVLGFILMIAGLSMGVTLVLLPIGIPVGLAGIVLFLWGLSESPRNRRVDTRSIGHAPFVADRRWKL